MMETADKCHSDDCYYVNELLYFYVFVDKKWLNDFAAIQIFYKEIKHFLILFLCFYRHDVTERDAGK